MAPRQSSNPYVEVIACLFITVVFGQSLFFKFTNAPETQFIFGTLDKWAAGFLVAGLFDPGGIFSAKVIGSGELVASILLFASVVTGQRTLRVLGALLAFCIITGALFFHLFTPLGVVIQGDGGLLFSLACGVWLCSGFLIVRNFGTVKALAFRLLPGRG